MPCNNQLSLTPLTEDITSLEYLDNGIFCINGTELSADTLQWSVFDQHKMRILLISGPTRDGITKSFALKAPSKLLGGYGKPGQDIKKFQDNIDSMDHDARYEREIQEYIRKVETEGALTPIDPPFGFLPKRGEGVFLWCDEVTHCQLKVKKEMVGGGVSVRVVKGVSIHTGKGRSIEKEYIAEIDKGRLILTNKSLSFIGDNKSLSYPLSKIISVEPWKDAIEITRDGVATKPIFRGVNGVLWATVLSELHNALNKS